MDRGMHACMNVKIYWVLGGVHRKQISCQSFNRQDVYIGSTPVEGEERIRAHRLKPSFKATHCACNLGEL